MTWTTISNHITSKERKTGMNDDIKSIIERYESVAEDMHLTLEAIEQFKLDSKNISEIHQFLEQFSDKDEFVGLIKDIKERLFFLKDELTTKEAALYLGMSVSTLYKKTMNNEIPFYRPSGRQIYFKRQELSQWILRNRNATNEEMQAEASLSDLTNMYALKRNKRPTKKKKKSQ